MPNQILCPYCKRLITLPTIEFGSSEKCPHCDLEFVVSHRLLPSEKLVGVKDADEQYELKASVPAPRPVASLFSDANRRAEEEALELATTTWRPMQVPPLELFLKRTLTYPFSSGTREWFFKFLIFSFAIEGLALLTLYMVNFPELSYYRGFAWMISALLFVLSIALDVIYLSMLSAVGLAILSDTAEGAEKLTNRPQGFFDCLQDTGYVLVNLFFGAVPASILLSLLPDSPMLWVSTMILSETILFPIFLLSALANNSMVTSYSKPVWRSVLLAWHTWILFYLFTVLLGESLVLFWRWIPYQSMWTNILCVSILLPMYWIIYFRLLGRLALYCSGRYDKMHPSLKGSGLRLQNSD